MEATQMSDDSVVREQLVNALIKRQAYMSFEDAVKDFPQEHINSRPPNVEYSFWHLLEHIRMTQWDILDYIRNSDYQSKEWPASYWPVREAETDWDGWQKTIKQFQADRQVLVDIVKDPASDLYGPIPHGWDGHNIVREIHVVSAHNAYHIGELGILRQVMQLWPR
jgi:hypothetical protein